jgi:hypothetical protein
MQTYSGFETKENISCSFFFTVKKKTEKIFILQFLFFIANYFSDFIMSFAKKI